MTVQVDYAPFGQIFQQLLDPAASNNPTTLNVIMLQIERWALQRNNIDHPDLLRNFQDFVSAILHSSSHATFLVVICPASPGLRFNPAILRTELELQQQLTSTPTISIVTVAELQSLYP